MVISGKAEGLTVIITPYKAKQLLLKKIESGIKNPKIRKLELFP